MAPATKYGGKIVECQPRTLATAKSKLTTLCTERTTGAARPASTRDAGSERGPARGQPRPPLARTPQPTPPDPLCRPRAGRGKPTGNARRPGGSRTGGRPTPQPGGPRRVGTIELILSVTEPKV